MIKTTQLLRRTLVAGMTVLLLTVQSSGSLVSADTQADCSPPDYSGQNGVHWPTGSDAKMFTYQCDGQYAGKWTSQYYVFDPDTLSTDPLSPATYTYNDSTGRWDSTMYIFSAAKGSYAATNVSVTTPPAGSVTIGGPRAAAQDDQTTGNANGTTGTSDGSSPNKSASELGTGSNAATNTTTNNSVRITNGTTASLNNNVLSRAGSGNSLVSRNTGAGDSNTGDAGAAATIINMLQSSSNVLNDPNIITFTANINGDVNGDLLLDPNQLGSISPASSDTTVNNNVTVNNSNDAAINNNINLGAQSGDATVSQNTNAGNATSGSAKAVADIVNVLNSAVTAGKSFVGTININGNLNGDILLPPDFIDQLLASNAPRTTATVDTAVLNNNFNLTNNNNQAINNAVSAAAATGNASVAENTAAGNATSGNANTNVTIFDLTNADVIASNDLLVFVNVLGTWVGLIMNAPAGSTAAEVGGGVSRNTTVNNNASLTNNNSQAINNNIKVAAKSGDATVSQNTKAGNAQSGDAKASVNLANLINSKLAVNGWFGLLFINVYGHWNGSFGVNTAAGDPLPAVASDSSVPAPVFTYVPQSPVTTAVHHTNASTKNPTSTAASPATQQSGAVLAAKTQAGNGTNTGSGGHADYILPAAGGILALMILAFGERKRFVGRH